MLTWLAALTFVFGISVAKPQVPGNGGKANHDSQTAHQEPGATQPSTATAQVQTAAAEQEHKNNAKPYQWHELYAPANMPNWFLALLGGWAGFMALKTLRTIERQTKATEEAVEASLQNAQTFVNKERARLFIRPSISGNFDAVFHVENLGSSPALVYYGFVGCEIVRKGKQLPLPPDYTMGDPEWVFGRADWVAKDASVWVGHHCADYIDEAEDPGLYADVMGGQEEVWFYGIVRYEDIVSGKGEEIRFCYRCHAFPNGKSFFTEAGPYEYRDRHPYDKPN